MTIGRCGVVDAGPDGEASNGYPLAATALPAPIENVLVENRLESLLTARGVFDRPLHGVSLKLFEPNFAVHNLLADAFTITLIPLGDELLEFAAFKQGVSCLEATCERVHARDVGVEKIDRLEGCSTHLGVEIEPTRLQAAVL